MNQKILNATNIKTFVLPVLAGISIFLAFERYNFLPGLFVLPFLLAGMRDLPLKRKLLAYWIMAIVTNLGGFGWIRLVAMDFGGLPAVLGWGLLLLFSAFNNLNFVAWAYLERLFGERTLPFCTAALFVATEQINPQVFPWYFGTALDSALVFYQTADIWGVAGLSFVAMTLIHLPHWLWQQRASLAVKKLELMALTGFTVLVAGYGYWALQHYSNTPSGDQKKVAVSVIQSNTTMEKFYGASLTVEDRLQEFESLVAFSKEAIAAHPDTTELLVWPEGSVHFPILNYQRIAAAASDLARSQNVMLAAGSVEIEQRSNRQRDIFNTQFVFDSQGEVYDKYRKIILLAFGEYIPLAKSLPFLQKWLPQSISQFTRGSEKPVFKLRDDVNWLPLICYEDIISGFIAGFDHGAADFMVNTTNDGWFGDSDASYLHKQMARPRTVEYRKPLLRALNTGSSQVIDAAGRTISRETELYTREYINTTLHLPKTPPRTIYAYTGNLSVYVLIAVVGILSFRTRYLTRVRKSDRHVFLHKA